MTTDSAAALVRLFGSPDVGDRRAAMERYVGRWTPAKHGGHGSPFGEEVERAAYACARAELREPDGRTLDLAFHTLWFCGEPKDDGDLVLSALRFATRSDVAAPWGVGYAGAVLAEANREDLNAAVFAHASRPGAAVEEGMAAVNAIAEARYVPDETE